MENASKALIIAGAILISILLISVGIIIMNAINDPVQQGASSAESEAAEIFNSKFTSFAGVQKGSTVRQLVMTIKASNATNPEHYINAPSSIKGFSTDKKYKVDFTYGEDGYIDSCPIQLVYE